jgi:Domain of unknown function (DUF1905)/Bacteriocin-protection, YdeI or OmpD-Associated
MFDGILMIEKFDGKGGWTFLQLPPLTAQTQTSFGMIRVAGTIDGISFSDKYLMPLSKGQLMFTIDAKKKLKKTIGDKVHLQFYMDDSPLRIPDELIICLQDAGIEKKFEALTFAKKRLAIKQIYSAKNTETIANRIVIFIQELMH